MGQLTLFISVSDVTEYPAFTKISYNNPKDENLMKILQRKSVKRSLTQKLD
ncbi:MAG: hypothetical protein RID09_30290 [Coleofasciculus sp. G1-WW12-02]|uniref:hypothetical protein n=1 Tax=Coleofasciculus sp. G1-WW12-02 TaxID=3068483 RepID=UPI003303E4C4